MNARKWQPLILFVSIFILLTACGQNNSNQTQNALLKTTNPAPVNIKNSNSSYDERVKHDISSFPEIYDVAVIKGKKDTLVAYKVKHMNRFQMKNIEKKMNKLLEEKYPKENFTISSDYKIFLEAVRLREDMRRQKLSDDKADKRLKKIIKMTREMT